jgi:hypothetical protein
MPPFPNPQRVRSGWPAITGLLLLSALPVFGGVLRLGELGAATESAPHVASPLAIAAHVVAMSTFCLLGAFQFSPALRVRRGWHRAAGRVLIPAGFIAALASIWLVVVFDGSPAHAAIAVTRLVFAIAMLTFLVMGVLAIMRRDFIAHGAWLTRAYAIAVSGGTQALVFALWTTCFGEVDAFGEAWLVAAGFAINSAAAELLVRRRSSKSTSPVSRHGELASSSRD